MRRRPAYVDLYLTKAQQAEASLARRFCSRSFDGTVCDGKVKVVGSICVCEYCGVLVFEDTRIV